MHNSKEAGELKMLAKILCEQGPIHSWVSWRGHLSQVPGMLVSYSKILSACSCPEFRFSSPSDLE